MTIFVTPDEHVDEDTVFKREKLHKREIEAVTDNKVNIGTLIHGTLRDRDLLPVFVAELEWLLPADSTDFADERALVDRLESDNQDSILDWEYADDVDRDEVAYLINEKLIDALNEYAPPHTYFGTHEGDGADFGFWPTGEDFSDTCEIVGRAMSANGEVEFVDQDCNVFVHVNDHGNITVSTLVCDGDNHRAGGTNLCDVRTCLVAGSEIWSVV